MALNDNFDDTARLEPLRIILAKAQALAASDDILLRVAGQRIAVIAADVLYETDMELSDVFALLPAMAGESRSPKAE